MENLAFPPFSDVSRGLRAPNLHSPTVYRCARCTSPSATVTEDPNAVQVRKRSVEKAGLNHRREAKERIGMYGADAGSASLAVRRTGS